MIDYIDAHKDRRVLQADHRLAGVPLTSQRSRARCSRNGPVGSWQNADGLVHPSDRGSQYLSYSERLAEAGAVASVGSRGDSYDNALAETINGLYKTEVIRRRGPWKNIDDVEFATLGWVDWFNRQLLEPIGDIPPAEYEMLYWTESDRTDTVRLTELNLH